MSGTKDQGFSRNQENLETTGENYKGQGNVFQWKNDLMAMRPLLVVTKEELLNLPDIPSELGDGSYQPAEISPSKGRIDTNLKQTTGSQRNSSVPVTRGDVSDVKKPDFYKGVTPLDYSTPIKDVPTRINAGSAQNQPPSFAWSRVNEPGPRAEDKVVGFQMNGRNDREDNKQVMRDSPVINNQQYLPSSLQNRIENKLINQRTSAGYLDGFDSTGLMDMKNVGDGQRNKSFAGNSYMDRADDDAIEIFRRALEAAEAEKEKTQRRDEQNRREAYKASLSGRTTRHDYSQDHSFDVGKSYMSKYLARKDTSYIKDQASMLDNSLNLGDRSHEWPYTKKVEWENKPIRKSPLLALDSPEQNSFLKIYYSGNASVGLNRDKQEQTRAPREKDSSRFLDFDMAGLKPYTSSSRTPAAYWYNR